MVNFRHEIEAWDGKTVAALEAIFAREGNDPGFVDALVDYAQQPILQKGATWLIKKRAESGARFTPQQIDAIYALLSGLETWEAKLHILQSMPALPIDANQKDAVEMFLRECLRGKNKFVRAWAYSGFYELAQQYPAYREEASVLFDRALHEEAASVKARVRNILKKGFSE